MPIQSLLILRSCNFWIRQRKIVIYLAIRLSRKFYFENFFPVKVNRSDVNPGPQNSIYMVKTRYTGVGKVFIFPPGTISSFHNIPENSGTYGFHDIHARFHFEFPSLAYLPRGCYPHTGSFFPTRSYTHTEKCQIFQICKTLKMPDM